MSTVTVFLIVIAFVGLPCVGVGAVLVACRSHARRIRTTARIVAALLILFVLAAVAEIAPYMWALHLETRWSAVHPATRVQLESLLSFYSVREIKPFQSLWGRDYVLGPGEKMVQYRLLYSPRAPLDVVYTRSDNITAIFTSYE
jgi:hypothetical protein